MQMKLHPTFHANQESGRVVTSCDGHDVIRLLPLHDDATPPALARAPSGTLWGVQAAGAGDTGAGEPRGWRAPLPEVPPPAAPSSSGEPMGAMAQLSSHWLAAWYANELRRHFLG